MELIQSLSELFVALFNVIAALVAAIAPWTPLVLWIAFWTLAVDWVKLRQFLWGGGIVGVLLIMFCAILVWGVVAPPESGMHSLHGLTVSNFVGKTMKVTELFVITMLCGSVQLSGICGNLCRFEEHESPEPGHAH